MWVIKLFGALQLFLAGVFGMPVETMTESGTNTEQVICPQFGTFYGYQLGHSGCCVNPLKCTLDVSTDHRIARQIEKFQWNMPPDSLDITQRSRRNAELGRPYTTSSPSSSLYTLCRSNVTIINPIFATSAMAPQTQVQLLQLPPLMTQAIVVELCEEEETPIVRGKCKQHYKWESVYTVSSRGNQNTSSSSRNSNDGQEQVTFQKEWILVEAGCDVAFNFNVYQLLNNHSYLISAPPDNLGGPTAGHQTNNHDNYTYATKLEDDLHPLVKNVPNYELSSSSSSSPYDPSTPPMESNQTTKYQSTSPPTMSTVYYPTATVTTTTMPTTAKEEGDLSGRFAESPDDGLGPHGIYHPKDPGHPPPPPPVQVSADNGTSGQNVQNLIYLPNSKEPREHNGGVSQAAASTGGYPRGYNEKYGPVGPPQVRSVKEKDYYAGGGAMGQSGPQNSSSQDTGTVYAKPYRRVYETPVQIGVPVYSMKNNPDRIRALMSRN